MATAEDIRATVARYTETMSAADKEGWLALFNPDASLEDPVGTDPHRGIEAIGAFFDLAQSLADSITLVRTGPTRVAGREAAFPMQAISDLGGTRMVIDIIDVMSFDDEARITSMRAFWDPAEMRPLDD